MEKMPSSLESLREQLGQAAAAKEPLPVAPRDVVDDLYKNALQGESYEDAATALASVEELRDFRKKCEQLPFASFQEMIEAVTNIQRLSLSEEDKARQIEALTYIMEQRVSAFSPRVADLYSAVLAELRNALYSPKFFETSEKIQEMKEQGDWQVLFSGEDSWDMKFNRIEMRLMDYLKGVRSRDRRDGKFMDDDIRKWRQEQLQKAPTMPQEESNESKPGVDPMERLKEGEQSPAIWSIYPAWGGYYKGQSFSKWDDNRNVWIEEKYTYKEVQPVPLSNNADYRKGPIDITMTATVVAGQRVRLQIPYTHGFHKAVVENRNCSVNQDQNGDLILAVSGEGTVQIKVFLAPVKDKKFKAAEPEKVKAPRMFAEFCEETNNKLEEIQSDKGRRGNIAKARAICAYVRSRVKYLAPKDRNESDYYNNYYNNHPKGFAGAVDEIKQGDCDVVNTYFAALCAKLNIPVRHVVGHSVKGKDKEGAASIHSGTGHGWSEVWDEIGKEWVRMDATPAGDPNLEEEDKAGGENAPGDYGQQEAATPSQAELEALREKLANRKENLSYTREERQLAEAAHIENKEARQIVKEINAAEQVRLPNGERVVDMLSRIFNAIVERRKSKVAVYDGPVRRREGGEHISDIVRHKIDIMAAEIDPLSREKPSEEVKEEENFDGFDVYFIGDKSGSMQNIVDNETLWQMQRRAEYLIFSSLYHFEKNLERAGLQSVNALSVRTQSISFRGNRPEDIDLDKALSPKFTALDKVTLWHSLTAQGGGNGDAPALAYVYEQIKKEIEENKRKGVKDNRLRLIIVCSDGGPDDPEAVQQLAENLGKLNAVVVGMGLTETAATVPIIFNTPYSRGDIVPNINDLPLFVAKHIVFEALRLFPAKARENAKQLIQTEMAKFKNIK